MSGMLYEVWSGNDAYWAQRYWGAIKNRGPRKFESVAEAAEWATPPRWKAAK